MIRGDARDWTSRFIATDERILERIAVVWPVCISALSIQPREDDITINLVDLLWKDPVVRRICHSVDYQFEPFSVTPSGAKYSKGKIDMAVLLDWNRERYVAYECKRLNVRNRGKKQSLAKAYVEDGMMRFLTEQYAESLSIGCMLGYVIDGDKPFAKGRLKKSIKSHVPLNLVTGPTSVASMGVVERFLTSHQRNGGSTIELRHALLPFPNPAG